jgi:hypothetical protein
MPRARNIPVRQTQSRHLYSLRCPHSNCNRAFKNTSGLKQHCRAVHPLNTNNPSPTRLKEFADKAEPANYANKQPTNSARQYSPIDQAIRPGLSPGAFSADPDLFLGPSSSPSRNRQYGFAELGANSPTASFGSPPHSDIGAGLDPPFSLPGSPYGPAMDTDMAPQTSPPISPHSGNSVRDSHRLRSCSPQHRHYPSSPMGRGQARRNRQARNNPTSKTYHPLINGAYSLF